MFSYKLLFVCFHSGELRVPQIHSLTEFQLTFRERHLRVHFMTFCFHSEYFLLRNMLCMPYGMGYHC